MSVVADHVRRWDAQVDRISVTRFLLAEVELPEVAEEQRISGYAPGHRYRVAVHELSSPRVKKLLRIIKALSTTSTSKPLLPASEIRDLILQTELVSSSFETSLDIEVNEPHGQYEAELEWLLLGKATVQTYGLVLNTFLGQIVPLSDDIWYWDEVLGSYAFSGLYAVQTAPLRMWAWTKDIYHQSRQRLHRFQSGTISEQDTAPASMSERWHEFYSIIRESIAQRSLANVRGRVFSQVALSRREAHRHQKQLRRLRDLAASGMGLLLDEGLSFDVTDDDDKSDAVNNNNNNNNNNPNNNPTNNEWKGVLGRSVALMDMVLRDVLSLTRGVSDFEDKVFQGVEYDPELSVHIDDSSNVQRPAVLARRLVKLLEVEIPEHINNNKKTVRQFGRPSRLIRYWLPGLLLFLSSSTILRILVNRKDDILNWVRNLGSTIKDFWFDWVVEPARKIVGTIRHDANSEIAIMSRDSLKADRESLERMVVDFALDKPDLAVGASSLTDVQVAEIRSKVKEGDVTPVLRAYEKDLRKPFIGAVRGDLIRALLIQVQKTKVDLEVAISGIDALLKSQELVFGFVGLTPGILVSVGVISYLRTLSGGRQGLRRSERAARSVRVLRNIDRILTEAVPTHNNLLSYKDHGLLVCEAQVLRKLTHGLLPGEVEREFLEDLNDLVNLKLIPIQMRALERIRWTYSQWLKR